MRAYLSAAIVVPSETVVSLILEVIFHVQFAAMIKACKLQGTQRITRYSQYECSGKHLDNSERDTEESDVPSNHAQEEIPDETIEELEALIVQGKKIGRC